MSWFGKIKTSIKNTLSSSESSVIPEGVWTKCDGCGQTLYTKDYEANLHVCQHCSHHGRFNPHKRLQALFDQDTYKEIFTEIQSVDPLNFKDLKSYKDRVKAAKKATNTTDALIVYEGKINGVDIVACAFNMEFMGGSMGSVVGEKFTRAAKLAQERKQALVCFSASGGARMQEGLFSLMQMAKTSAILAKLKENGIPFISVLTDPTFGGVSASLAMLGDVIIAEPKALIGFAGPRVIEQTIREKLPEGFQRAEFLVEHGAVDQIVDRRQLKDYLADLVAKMLHLPKPEKFHAPAPAPKSAVAEAESKDAKATKNDKADAQTAKVEKETTDQKSDAKSEAKAKNAKANKKAK